MDDFLKVGPPIAVQFLSVPLKQLYALSYTIYIILAKVLSFVYNYLTNEADSKP